MKVAIVAMQHNWSACIEGDVIILSIGWLMHVFVVTCTYFWSTHVYDYYSVVTLFTISNLYFNHYYFIESQPIYMYMYM